MPEKAGAHCRSGHCRHANTDRKKVTDTKSVTFLYISNVSSAQDSLQAGDSSAPALDQLQANVSSAQASLQAKANSRSGSIASKLQSRSGS
ncbi:MAG: hypothetical protein SPF15_09605 [Candidatus Cryptobacteroides sp.]|nr:hypothetical protein [Candidatus Cryptobacteroides sp.]